MQLKPILFSAIQPSGNLTLGNYIGTMRHWSKMQNDYDCLYCIADLHAMTSISQYSCLKKSTLDVLSLYLACGIKPNKSILFLQSHVHQHNQLNWILNCFSRFSELLRMTQFKTKKKFHYDSIMKNNLGLFNYPILMASDILLYQTNIVPVGQDQKQHLELTRNIARRFNLLYGNIFTVPVPLIDKYGSKIMALLEPHKKMSKSDHNKNNVIFLLENMSSVILKIQHAVTDSDKPPRIYYNKKNKPGISNLLEILSIISKKDISHLEKELENVTYSEFKNIVSEYVSNLLSKLQASYTKYRNNELYLKNILYDGAVRARSKSEIILKKIYSKLNLFL
ncbi:MAG: tryptophan--tRNA ligase [Buchnera aphidicola (Pentalonia nigronervosa)]|jgi:tryptophanyl-tRNA synthetase|uniref:Tryptophan--tRNA ligase n=1 Tax=Buchnera aphidicola (Pentalonia nigronervosa) TaxID=1309793 RepID=A0A7H1AZ05_9GAMM|nr:MAG: tryptophan--tRNA ligase [Buchnera aphidicola (Pentalonia nigronervosa)]